MTESERGTVCFAHGMESGPWGSKITVLAEVARARHWKVISPDFRFSKHPHRRVEWFLENPPEGPRPWVFVGSSMGAYVVAQTCTQYRPDALLLMAPALYFPSWDEEPQDCPQDTVVVHGWRDSVVLVDVAWRFAKPRKSVLHLLDSEHDLNDQISTIANIFAAQLDRQSSKTR